MSDEKTTNAPVAASAAPEAAHDGDAVATAPVTVEASKSEAAPTEAKAADSAPASAAETAADKESDKPTEATPEKPTAQPKDTADVEMTDAAEAPKPEAADEYAAKAETAAPEQSTITDAAATAVTPNKPAPRQRAKSIGGSAAKGKKLNKKASKARILHTDAKPGEHYFVKLKGFPQWPVIICDEDMLPLSLLNSRPVTARRADGTYREEFDDGGRRVGDRTFPVMYLHTNEFGWVPNSDLIDLDPATVKDIKTDKMRKDLQAAHELASENHPLSFYKEVLQQFQEELIEQEKAKAAKAATPSKKKGKTVVDEDEDVEMADAADEEEAAPVKEKKAKKRKAEENIETPQRSDSVKKPKIKLTTNSTPKSTNGASSTPAKAAKPAAEPKVTKPKVKKAKEPEEKKEKEQPATPKEPELTQEEKHARKEKEVLFLRHKLQKGLLTRDQEPKEDEMKLMSEYIVKLEAFPDLEVSIIRTTKINKVLKAILKLENIPKEQEFKFKERSQVLLDKWNKLLTADGAPAAAPASADAPANGVNGVAKKEVAAAAKEETKTNGFKAAVAEETEKAKDQGKDGEAKADEAAASSTEKTTEETKATDAVETSA
ncbi:PWWP domain-containing protein [Apodospora peruviana]|uniref:PWWP domain-containing protein n=1 Tax=Apodospora peruviana TaxID=516989 RepID=A0AAE0MFB3_9PEZI|nr:PWWP domain-containing protein [Apodospora peruviana]